MLRAEGGLIAHVGPGCVRDGVNVITARVLLAYCVALQHVHFQSCGLERAA